ncbi:hypothetical protein NDU88_002479 [Pleurodeles waltl]|uniref:Uncharacterized protein n=1 Tax=Pleurodeles waltl TaxID=8319 RepID=A0AAV7REM3_PLEWA|nr:hypothetical protein NDU88_002479 [Pleurodeles waltl]
MAGTWRSTSRADRGLRPLPARRLSYLGDSLPPASSLHLRAPVPGGCPKERGYLLAGRDSDVLFLIAPLTLAPGRLVDPPEQRGGGQAVLPGWPGRVSTGLFLTLPWLEQDLRGELFPEPPLVSDFIRISQDYSSIRQAAHVEYLCMTRRRSSGPGAGTRQQGQK